MRVLISSLAAACAAALSAPALAQDAGPQAPPAPSPPASPSAPSAAPAPATPVTVKAGAVVRDSAGVSLGTVDQAMLDEGGGLKAVAIRSSEGEVYALPAAGFTVQGEAVVAAWTKDQIEQARKAQAPAAPGQP